MSITKECQHIFHNFPNNNSFFLRQLHKTKYDITNLFKLNFNLFHKKQPKALSTLITQLKTYYFGEQGYLIKRIKWLKSALYPEITINNKHLHNKINVGKLFLYELKDNHNIYINRDVESKKAVFRRSSHFTYDSNFKTTTSNKHNHKRKVFLSEDLTNLNTYIMNITNTFSRNNILITPNKTSVINNNNNNNHDVHSSNPLTIFDNMYKRKITTHQNHLYKRPTHIINNNNNTNIRSRPITAYNKSVNKLLTNKQPTYNIKRRCQSSRPRCDGNKHRTVLSKDNTRTTTLLLKTKINDISRENISNERKIRRVFSWGNSPLSVKVSNFICNPVASSKQHSQVIISQTEDEIKKDVEIALDISLKGEPVQTYKVIVNKLKHISDSDYINRILDLSNSVTKCNETTAYKFGDIIKKEYLGLTKKDRECLSSEHNDNDDDNNKAMKYYWNSKLLMKDKAKYKQRKFMLKKSRLIRNQLYLNNNNKK